MKKIYLLVLILVFTITGASGQFTKIGGGLGASSGFPFHQVTLDANKSGHFDISFKGIYELSLPFHHSPSFTLFMPHVTKVSQFANEEFKTTVSTIMFDLNGHYVFNSLDKFEFYGLAGLDFLLAGKKEVIKITGSAPSTSSSKENDNAFGLNLGAGTYMKMTEQIDLYVEAKYIVSKYDQFMVNVGLLLNLQWLSKNENPGI
jgi:hypothetical protein